MFNKDFRLQYWGVWNGISFGTALAIAISWSMNKSILWAMLHGLLGWVYVIYYAIAY